MTPPSHGPRPVACPDALKVRPSASAADAPPRRIDFRITSRTPPYDSQPPRNSRASLISGPPLTSDGGTPCRPNMYRTSRAGVIPAPTISFRVLHPSEICLDAPSRVNSASAAGKNTRREDFFLPLGVGRGHPRADEIRAGARQNNLDARLRRAHNADALRDEDGRASGAAVRPHLTGTERACLTKSS